MRYRCNICGYIYDDLKEKILFEQLPDDWRCPLCGARKSDFSPLDVDGTVKVAAAPIEDLDDMEGLTVGQMAALCSNLARGCEKQYLFKEMGQFNELAEYFSSVSPPSDSDDIKDIAERIMSDNEGLYPAVRSVASESGDRGALRICVWGEKVTRMLGSILSEYIEKGEDLLKDTEIWVCTVCGFVYIGDRAPERCPVCSVPGWKFQRMEAMP